MDWFTLFANALWIGGLAVILATLSVAYWQVGRRAARWRAVIAQVKYQLALNLGFTVFAAGLAFSTSAPAWRVFWFGVTLSLALRFFFLRKSDKA